MSRLRPVLMQSFGLENSDPVILQRRLCTVTSAPLSDEKEEAQHRVIFLLTFLPHFFLIFCCDLLFHLTFIFLLFCLPPVFVSSGFLQELFITSFFPLCSHPLLLFFHTSLRLISLSILPRLFSACLSFSLFDIGQTL